MEKWQFAAEIESAMSAMDYSQISELATAIMDSWGPELLPPQPSEATKVKQEPVPMEEIDPLDSFSFWDGETFYGHQDTDSMQTDPLSGGPMPPLLEYEEMTREEGEAFKDSAFLQNAPTLAQLNSPPGGEFDFFLAADDSSCSLHPFSPPNSSYSSGGLLGYVPSSGYIDIKPPHSQQQSSLSSSCPPPTSRLLPPASHFLPPVCPQNSPASDSAFFSLHQQQAPPPIAPPPRQQQQQAGLLSSSAPPDVTMATYFPKLRAELPGGSSPGPRSVTERSLSGFSSLSLSNDDESGSFVDDEDEDDDYSSDEDVLQYESDDLLSWPLGTSPPDGGGKGRKHRFFWQYNLQSRGSRAQQILPRRREGDPHVLDDAFDPVFSEECALPVKHSGKARRGDGNDLTPDPRKLFGIGLELRKLNRLIYNVNPAEGGKPLSRKEKNKLASRVCRLKKKAQHEANKIKLFGLQQEHRKLLSILSETRELLKYKIENLHDQKLSNCSKKLEAFLAANEPYKVAGNTTSFVNEVLEKVAKGESDGGLGRL